MALYPSAINAGKYLFFKFGITANFFFLLRHTRCDIRKSAAGRFGGETAFLKKRKAFRDPKFVPRRYMFRGLARLSWPMPECVLLVLRASVQIVCKSRDGVTYRVEVLFPILLCRWPITDIRGVLSSSRSFLSNRWHWHWAPTPEIPSGRFLYDNPK